jgi:transposase
LARASLEAIPGRKKPKYLLGDKLYYSGPKREEFLRDFGTELIAKPKKNYRDPVKYGRKLNRLKRRWKIERLFAWIQSYRRLSVRYERYLAHYLGFLLLACTMILARHL